MSIQIIDVEKFFGKSQTPILKKFNFTINDREFVALTGKSGSGKSTLLYIMSTLDKPTRGKVVIDGMDIAEMDSIRLHQFRNSCVGFVFQFHHLLPELTAIENVLMPAMKAKKKLQLLDYGKSLLSEFGLSNKQDHFPSQLSGGEQQRVAIARALIMSPRYIFADEPTGNLDSQNGELVMKILRRFNRESGTTVVFVTHDPDFAASAERQIVLVDGACQ